MGLLTWLILAGAGMLLLPFAITTPGAAFAWLGALAGLAGCALFIGLGAPDWAAWMQVGCAALGIVGATIAVGWLNDETVISGARTEVMQAGALGVQLPLFATAMFIALLLALHGVEPVV